jgi:hypothetical protein
MCCYNWSDVGSFDRIKKIVLSAGKICACVGGSRMVLAVSRMLYTCSMCTRGT